MIEIDGSMGEGGGQIVRSSLALAAVTGQKLRLRNIRRGRSKPGLLRQHLAGVRAISQICPGTVGSSVEGAELGSTELVFTPSPPRGGDYTFEVGSAGSAVLVAQTILPALLIADAPSDVTIGGGTHAAWAPPFDFFERCYLPLLARMGVRALTEIQSHGFYPAGGGKISLTIHPVQKWRGQQINERHGTLQPRVLALAARVPESVAERECDVIRRKTDWEPSAFEAQEVVRSGGPGNVVMIECGFDNVRELFIGFGKKGVKAERVARGVLADARKYLSSHVPVGSYLADQLLLPMGMAAANGCHSEFVTSELTPHSKTHIEVLQQFLDIQIRTDVRKDGTTHVSLQGSG